MSNDYSNPEPDFKSVSSGEKVIHEHLFATEVFSEQDTLSGDKSADVGNELDEVLRQMLEQSQTDAWRWSLDETLRRF